MQVNPMWEFLHIKILLGLGHRERMENSTWSILCRKCQSWQSLQILLGW